MEKNSVILKSIYFSVVCLLVGCGPSSTPESTIKSYLNANMSGDYEQAYQYVSADDKEVKTLQEYTGEKEEAEGLVGDWLEDKVSYEVLAVEEEGDRAKAEVAITAPDFSGMFGDLLGAAFMSAFNGKEPSDEQIQEMIREKYRDGEVPMTTEKETLDLVREEKGWRVVLNWKSDELMADAEELQGKGQLVEALEKYEAVLAIDPEREEAQIARDEVKSEIALVEEKRDYIANYLLLEDFRVRKQRRYSFSNPEHAIFGTIRNKGSRTLSEVEVTVYFLNEEGNPIAEEDYHPVLVTEYSLSDNKLLKAGYVEDFGYYVEEDAPTAWGGNARAEITDVSFQ